MENLKNYGVQELNTKELQEVNGGASLGEQLLVLTLIVLTSLISLVTLSADALEDLQRLLGDVFTNN